LFTDSEVVPGPPRSEIRVVAARVMDVKAARRFAELQHRAPILVVRPPRARKRAINTFDIYDHPDMPVPRRQPPRRGRIAFFFLPVLSPITAAADRSESILFRILKK
jgi:hypothetical protein